MATHNVWCPGDRLTVMNLQDICRLSGGFRHTVMFIEAPGSAANRRIRRHTHPTNGAGKPTNGNDIVK
jgi:hypothetical protein